MGKILTPISPQFLSQDIEIFGPLEMYVPHFLYEFHDPNLNTLAWRGDRKK